MSTPSNKRLAAPVPTGGSLKGNKGASTPGVSFNAPAFKGAVKPLRRPAK